MGFRVNRRTLLLIAGCVWIIAGINILRIGIVTWLNDAHYWLFKVGEAIVVFLLFFHLSFAVCLLNIPSGSNRKGKGTVLFHFSTWKAGSWWSLWLLLALRSVISNCYPTPLFRYFIPDFRQPWLLPASYSWSGLIHRPTISRKAIAKIKLAI